MGLPLPSLLQTITGLVVVYALYYVRWQFTVGASRRRLIKQHGCKPITKHPELYSGFGIRHLQKTLEAVKAHKLLELRNDHFLRYGNTLLAKNLFQDDIITIEPENIKTILSTNFKDWGISERRRAAFSPLLGHGIFSVNGAAWQHSRDMLRPNFVRSQVGDLGTLEVHVNHLLNTIPRDGSTVDLSGLFFRLTMDSATEFLFGESTNSLSPNTPNESGDGFAKAFNDAQDVCGNRARFGRLAMLKSAWRNKKDIAYVHSFVDRYVQAALRYRSNHDLEKIESGAEGRYVFLYELAKQTNDPVKLRDELLSILLAGRDTTASLLTNVWFTLAKRPDIWAKLRAEIDTLHGEHPSIQQINEMKYLRAVLNECSYSKYIDVQLFGLILRIALRLYPVVPGNSRMAFADTVLPLGGGLDGQSPVFIPKDTIVSYAVYSMHRRNDYYGEDADEFRPERWSTLRPIWEYLPFNGGPRICIGRKFPGFLCTYIACYMTDGCRAICPHRSKLHHHTYDASIQDRPEQGLRTLDREAGHYLR